MAPFAPTLNTLREWLRDGWAPEFFQSYYARRIGSGAERVAWRVGVFVVKGVGGWAGKRPQASNRIGIRYAHTRPVWCGDFGWDIQVAYTPLRKRYGDETDLWWRRNYQPHLDEYDSHPGNIGVDHRGRFVQFDW